MVVHNNDAKMRFQRNAGRVSGISTEVEVFLDKRVCETRQTVGANSRRGATKKREISQTLLSINLHFSVAVDGCDVKRYNAATM